MLDNELHKRLKAEARNRGTSVSELVRAMLARDLGITRPLDETIERIGRRRARIVPSTPDSAVVVRRSRDRGW